MLIRCPARWLAGCGSSGGVDGMKCSAAERNAATPERMQQPGSLLAPWFKPGGLCTGFEI